MDMKLLKIMAMAFCACICSNQGYAQDANAGKAAPAVATVPGSTSPAAVSPPAVPAPVNPTDAGSTQGAVSGSTSPAVVSPPAVPAPDNPTDAGSNPGAVSDSSSTSAIGPDFSKMPEGPQRDAAEAALFQEDALGCQAGQDAMVECMNAAMKNNEEGYVQKCTEQAKKKCVK